MKFPHHWFLKRKPIIAQERPNSSSIIYVVPSEVSEGEYDVIVRGYKGMVLYMQPLSVLVDRTAEMRKQEIENEVRIATRDNLDRLTQDIQKQIIEINKTQEFLAGQLMRKVNKRGWK